MPPKRKLLTTQIGERREPVQVHFVKFQPHPYPASFIKSGTSLTVLRDKIRTYLLDSPEKIVNNAKTIEPKKVNIEIPFKMIEDVNIVPSRTNPNVKAVAIFTKEIVKSVEGHVLANQIFFYFSKTVEKEGLGGVNDFNKFLNSLQVRGLTLVKASTQSSEGNQPSSSPAEDDDGDGDKDGDEEEQQEGEAKNKAAEVVDENLELMASVDEPVSGIGSPVASLLEDEIHIPSSQRVKHTLFVPETPLESNDDDEENDRQQQSSGKKARIESCGVQVKKSEVMELEACLEAIKMQVMQTHLTAGKKAKVEQQRLKDKLWQEVKKETGKTQREVVAVATRIKESTDTMQQHGQLFQEIIKETETQFGKLRGGLEYAYGTIQRQQKHLSGLKPPF